MIISFQLTMPNVGSWNGQWTGANRPYFVVKNFKKAEIHKEHFTSLLEKGKDSWYYDFGDGWGANVEAEIINSSEAKKRRKITAGFYGYNWMIDSIIKHGFIANTVQQKRLKEN